MKKLIVIIVAALAMTGCKLYDALDYEKTSGRTGRLSWRLDKYGTLVIKGKGAMPDYKATLPLIYGDAPWHFHKKNIKTVIIGDGVTTIGDKAFHHCINLSSVTIPEGVTKIGSMAFASCRLKNVVIPSSVTRIGHGAFGSLKTVTIMATVPPTIIIEDFLCNFGAEDGTLYVPAGCVDAYKADEVWSAAFAEIVEQQAQ